MGQTKRQTRGKAGCTFNYSKNLTKPSYSPSRVRQIFALLIGIDKYMHCDDNIIKNLSGCNNDVDDVADFLRTTLHVPDSNITQLRDEGATFAGITEALEGLANDVRITKGDAIFVFYAGHGAEVWTLEGEKFGGKKVQLLAPHDFIIDQTRAKPSAKVSEDGERCDDIQFNVVKNGLLDINLGRLLDTIADVKGDNIVSPIVHFTFFFFVSTPFSTDRCIGLLPFRVRYPSRWNQR